MIGVGVLQQQPPHSHFAFHSPLLISSHAAQSLFAAGQENPFSESIEANNFSFTELRLFAS